MGQKDVAGQLSAESRGAGGVTVIDLRGSVCQGDEITMLRRFLRERLDEKPPRLLLNFQGITHMDSGGLGAVVEARAHAIAIGTELRCSNLSPLIRKLFYQLRLEAVLEIFHSEEEALAGWG